MSLKKSATRRLAWLAGSSLLTAGVAAASSLGLAPTSVQAQTCTPAAAPAANPGPDTYTCLAGTFPTGITYSSDGNLSVGMAANGAVVATTVTANGVNLTGNGADSVTWTSTVGGVTGGATTAGPVIDALTATGAINISTANVLGTAATVTHGIRARSTSGAITISTGGSVSASNTTTGVNAIEAVTAGAIAISTGGDVNGRIRAIFTNTSSGSGTTTITTASNMGSTFSTSPEGGIEAITGTGALTINLNPGAFIPTVINSVRTAGAGVGAINVAANVQLLRLDPNSSAAITVNNSGTLGKNADNDTADYLIGTGTQSGALVINNNGGIKGRFTFGGFTGGVTIHNNTGSDPATLGWHTGGLNSFGAGDDLIDNAADGVIATGYVTTFAFGAGNDRIVNAGRFIVGRFIGGSATITGLETFENTGLILLGSYFLSSIDFGLESDLKITTSVIAQGVDFTGSGASRIALDANLAGVTQTGCPVTPTAADCIDFTGGSTAGSTLLTVRDQHGILTNGALNDGITLIVGSSAAEDFVLDPNSDYYVESAAGPALQKRLVAYHLVYDDAIDSHMLVGTLAPEAFQPGTFAASAQETWRATAGAWLTRQADLRATPGGLEDSGGAWARIGASASERDGEASYTQGSSVYSYDLGHKQRTSHLVFGVDMLRTGSENGAAVVGGMVGFVRSDVEFDASPTETISTGFTGGIYASYVSGPLFIDGVLNLNLVHLKADAPDMNLGQGLALEQDIQSIGGQLEAGWRLDVGGAFVEPLGGLSYVVTRFDDIDVPGGGGSFDFENKYTSVRAGAGLRAGVDSEFLGMTSSFSLTGRYWNELEGENSAAVIVQNGGTVTPLTDDVSGNFTEVAGSAAFYSAGGGVSGFVNLGGRFGDEFRSIDGSVGVRLRW